MGLIAIIFGIMSYFYTYVTPEELGDEAGKDEKKTSEENGIPLEDHPADGENMKV